MNTLWPKQNGQHFTDDIFKCISFNENVWISIKVSLKFVPKGPIKNIPALVQIMPWRCPRDKPLSEPMMVGLPTHIYITPPQWVNTLWPGDAIWHQRSWSTLVQVMAWCLTAPSHYLNQCWLNINGILWHSFPGNINLTLYMLNFRREHKTYIYILCHSSTLIWHTWLKSFLK